MKAEDVFRVLNVAGEPEAARSLLERLDTAAPEDWRVLAAALAVRLTGAGPVPTRARGGLRVIGIAGGQGAGKSTLARLLVQALQALGQRAATGSIDDFYLTRGERLGLADAVHPLLATRGVPGTHDVALCLETLDALDREGPVALPRFDKGRDDRCRRTDWPVVDGPLDWFVLEGWCLGAAPQPATLLEAPVNALEAEEDPDGRWRRYVNDALDGPYAALWERVVFWLYLRVPDMAAVTRWRTEQERALPARQRMTPEALKRFVAHYERLTRWMFETMPERSDLVAQLGEDHRLVALTEGPGA